MSVTVRDPRRAYQIVDAFEAELADYTGAPHAVCVNSCTNALFLALNWERIQGCEGPIDLVRRTYVGVAQAVKNAGFEIKWDDDYFDWQDEEGCYLLSPTRVWDCARALESKGFRDYDRDCFVCLSFHSAKQLPLGRGGAILTDNQEAADWFKAARMDGRVPGSDKVVFPGWHMPMPPDVAARGLDILSRWNDTNYNPPPLPPTDYPDLSLL